MSVSLTDDELRIELQISLHPLAFTSLQDLIFAATQMTSIPYATDQAA